MAITLSANYLAELKKGSNTPVTIMEIALDSGTVKYGTHTGNFDDVKPCIESVSSLQNRLDQKKSVSTRGQITFTVIGRDIIKSLIADEFLKNRRIIRQDGFLSNGFAYADYAPTFNGKISDWTRKGDKMTITVSDDLIDGQKKIPVENDTKTQFIDYTNGGAGQNPVDIMQSILKSTVTLGISTSLIDDAQFDNEQSLWLNNWKFSRVITEPRNADDYLNELQLETNSFIVHDGEKISYKVFAPPIPGSTVEAWSDNNNILSQTLTEKSGYRDEFFNRVVFYYDYDESGGNDEANFETGVIALDADSQSTAEWDETKSKEFKSKWIRSLTHVQPSNSSGLTIYHVSKGNSTGSGRLTFNFDGGGQHTLQWTAPFSTIGEAVNISQDGKYQVFDTDKTKYARVIVTTSSLNANSTFDDITISPLNGALFAGSIAQKHLNRFRDPAASINFQVDINNVAFGSNFIKPTDLKDITTDEVSEKGSSAWSSERTMLISVRPDMEKGVVDIGAIKTGLKRKYAFIGSATMSTDYDSATDLDKEYGYIGSTANLLGNSSVSGDFIW